jgi:hypothetical protein
MTAQEDIEFLLAQIATITSFPTTLVAAPDIHVQLSSMNKVDVYGTGKSLEAKIGLNFMPAAPPVYGAAYINVFSILLPVEEIAKADILVVAKINERFQQVRLEIARQALAGRVWIECDRENNTPPLPSTPDGYQRMGEVACERFLSRYMTPAWRIRNAVKRQEEGDD